jgi:hypothetical protein
MFDNIEPTYDVKYFSSTICLICFRLSGKEFALLTNMFNLKDIVCFLEIT